MVKNYAFAFIFLGLAVLFYLSPNPDVGGLSLLLTLRLISCVLLIAFGGWALFKVVQQRFSSVLLGATGLLSLAIGLAGLFFSLTTYLVS